MEFAVSNIAWATSDRLAAYARLNAAGITRLEIAPGLFFPESADPFIPSEFELANAVEETSQYGLELVSMQSLLFGVAEADLFGDARGRLAFTRGNSKSDWSG